ncbi:synaptic vesicular amine transporter [Calliphora vicina]|uniref:synaptic vesicular amine transporter n=1 Tax=Calliphora vicina TaxID=7373 RepID=UPI00325BB860
MSKKQQQHLESDTNMNLNESQANRASVLNETFNERRTSSPNYNTPNRSMIAVIVYLALLLDNVLLTVIVPILPDYLATINNRTTKITTLHYASSNAATGIKSINDSGGLGILGAAATAQHLAYRNLDGTAQQQQQQSAALQQQTHIMTKHPIPGKSMVNFSLIHLVSDDNNSNNNKVLMVTPINEQQRNSISTDHVDESKMGENYLGLINNNNEKGNKMAETMSKDHNNDDANLASENSSIGILLAMKALVQLIFNPIVGNMSTKYGYRIPIVLGTFCLLISSLVFAVGESYTTLIIARSVQGIGSACIGVCGMSLVAQHYPEEDRRSKVMGIILGSIALGVLLGYPFGGILYDLFGKSAPFIILSTIIFINLGMQLVTMDLSIQPEVIVNVDQQQQQPKWKPLLQSKMILAIVIAIWVSTSTMAILEPCLPIWLMQYLKPTKWQLGTVFIPDSIGYFVGTNFFGSIAYKYGQIKVSCISLLLVGISSVLIPSATTVAQLLLPHFGLGLGIGIIDAALVPLLATFVDATLAQEDQIDMDTKIMSSSHTMSSYGTVYAIQQTSVSLAYCLAPLIGGELAQAFGFAWLMRIVGFFNIIYGPTLVYLYYKYDPKILRDKQNEMLLSSTGGGHGSKYKQLYNAVDTE